MKPDGKMRDVDGLRSLVKGFRFYSKCIRELSLKSFKQGIHSARHYLRFW